ncbi:hypothetical protein D477_000660 [Arthrobacter crystallopoietes BAB-32]|uniref:Uncharacterized protein n=1 Tax=Arthrobacter crystallopoietes BAB-32 TaxID=1246476 RepID=N1V819_9MICC|nr:hypothetical protein D477_000660 [Arthrobacter crystallopoietes BAB-32]
MAFENPFGDPVDPKYLRFKDYIEDSVLSKPEVLDVRWSQWHGSWYRYPRSRFEYIDFGAAPGPQSPLERKLVSGGGLAWVYVMKSSVYGLPGLYREVSNRYERLDRDGHPYAVWNIYDGSWQNIRRATWHDTPPDDDDYWVRGQPL